MDNRIKEEREKRGMTQMALAVAAGLHPGHVSRIENGSGCELKTARKLADALEVTLDELVGPRRSCLGAP